MARLIWATISAWLISFGLFAFMAVMIPKDKEAKPIEEERFLSFQVVSMAEEELIIERSPPLPPKPQIVTQLPTIIPAPEPVASKSLLVPIVPLPEVSSSVAIEKIALTKEYTTPAHPIVRTLPRYPLNAALSKLEGWVKIVFEINPQGEVINPHVLDSTPPGVFEESALNAIKGWRYKPKFDKGKYLHQKDLLVQINFDL